MDCSLIQGDLIAYHFATVPPLERAQVEAHLIECTACLRAYLALKAHIDHTGSDLPQPSEASRLKLRAAVEDRFRPTPLRRARRWLARPVPFYQGLVAVAVLLLGAALGPLVARELDPEVTADISNRVDTSRTTSESLSIY